MRERDIIVECINVVMCKNMLYQFIVYNSDVLFDKNVWYERNIMERALYMCENV